MITRTEAVALARSWEGTPYVTGGRIRGAGCDCATFIAEYLLGIGAAAEIPLWNYAQDWFLHATEERYFDELSRYAPCVWEGRCAGRPPAEPGDIALFRVNLSSGPSPRYNHGAILLGGGRALHCFADHGVCEVRPALFPLTTLTEMAIFNPWETAL